MYFNQPIALDDGETVLFTILPAGGAQRARLASIALTTGEITKYDVNALCALGVTDNVLVYITPTGALQAVGFDAKARRIIGNPVALGPTVLVRVSGAADAAMSGAGTLVYQSSTSESQVGWVDQTGQFKPLIPERRPYGFPRLSPDGKRIAITTGTGGRGDVWIHDMASGTPTRVTTEGAVSERVEWTPDGKRILYRTDRGKRSAIWWQPADLSGSPTPLLASDLHDYYEGIITPDGKSIIYQTDDATSSQADIFWRSIEGDTTPKVISATNFVEAQARISPDGKWIAFVTDASGTSQVVVQPFPGPGGQVQVSVTGGTEPIWSRDGRKIFYRDGRKMTAASVTTSPTFSVTARMPLFADTYMFAPSPHPNYDVALDGSRFLMIRSSETPKLTVVHGWFTELRARMAGRR